VAGEISEALIVADVIAEIADMWATAAVRAAVLIAASP